jgi:DNA polymerase-3 subunit beta
MEIILNKEDFLNSIRVTEKITSLKGVQPVLGNILIETLSNDRIRFCATDLIQTISLKTKAEVLKNGKTTINPKKLMEIIPRLENKPITLKIDEEENKAIIECGKSNFTLNTIKASEFPEIPGEDREKPADIKSFEIDVKTFNKAIKQTVYCCTQIETTSVLGGVNITIEDNTLEIAATDGNRLTRVRKPINSKGEGINFIVPSKTLNEFMRISSIKEEEKIKIELEKSKICFNFTDMVFTAKTIDGTYPKYKQLIPLTNDKVVVFNKDELIESIERVAPMVNERTNIIKLIFENNKVTLKADTSETGSATDEIEIKYEHPEIIIAFNYKYLLDSLKNIDGDKIKVEMATSLSATLFKPSENEDECVCLIMPVQVR